MVLPDQDTVIAMTSGTRNMQGVMNLAWEKLLPAMQPRRLRADRAADKKLAETLAGLTMHPQTGNASPGNAGKWSGKQFIFPTNDQRIEAAGLEFDPAGRNVTLVTRCNGAEQRTACGDGAWTKGRMTYAAFVEQPGAASGAWTADGVYTAQLCFYETPFCLTVSLKYSGDRLLYDCEYNVNFGPTKQPQLTGKTP